MKALTEAQVERYRHDGFLFPFPALNEAERANCLGGLERYERWRRSDALVLAAVTDGLNRLFSNTIAPVKLARDAGLAIVNRLPPLKRLLMQHAMGVLGDRPRLAKGEPL